MTWRERAHRAAYALRLRFPKQWLQMRRHRPGHLPSFLICGAAKAGTTSLFHYMVEASSQIRPPVRKEVNYFSDLHALGIDFYRRFFPVLHDGEITGEASPTYMLYHQAARRIRSALGAEVKLIVLLRDPVDRALSEYQHVNFTDKVRICDHRPLEEAFFDEPAWFRLPADDPTPFHIRYRYHMYISKGIYHALLQRYLDVFSRDQLLVLEYHDLVNDPRSVTRTALDFVGVAGDRLDALDVRPRNTNPAKRRLPGEADIRARLRDFYRPHDEALARLLGRRFSWMDQ